jgi:hypothetical protein
MGNCLRQGVSRVAPDHVASDRAASDRPNVSSRPETRMQKHPSSSVAPSIDRASYSGYCS